MRRDQEREGEGRGDKEKGGLRELAMGEVEIIKGPNQGNE